jgi:two-component system response regulator HydG
MVPRPFRRRKAMENSMRILIVDDEDIVRGSFFHWFRRLGYPVETAASGFEALKKLEEKTFDVLILDLRMPGEDGIKVLKEIKKSHPDTDVVMITAYGSIDTAVQSIKTGATDYLCKPFKPEKLSLIVKKIVDQKSAIKLQL